MTSYVNGQVALSSLETGVAMSIAEGRRAERRRRLARSLRRVRRGRRA